MQLIPESHGLAAAPSVLGIIVSLGVHLRLSRGIFKRQFAFESVFTPEIFSSGRKDKINK